MFNPRITYDQLDQLIFKLCSDQCLQYSGIDADASLSAATNISVPKANKNVSLGHIHKRKLEKTEVPTKESSYLLLPAITPFHQDFSGTSVM